MEWTSVADHCYQLYEDDLSFEVATDTCRRKGGDLLAPEEEHVSRLMQLPVSRDD